VEDSGDRDRINMLQPLRILVKRGPSGLLIASSPDLPGLHVMERTERELHASLRELIPVLFAEKGERVLVAAIIPLAAEERDNDCPWVVADLRASKSEHIGR
jgi:hypothetical protein